MNGWLVDSRLPQAWRAIRMADAPKEGDKNSEGLVFHDHRWHRPEDVSSTQESKQASPVSGITDNTTDFSVSDEWRDVFYGEPSQERVQQLSKWLKSNPDAVIRLYHGTSAKHPVKEKGLLKTSANRRRSLQSGSGFVYLSVYPDMAKTFAKMGYPGNDVAVYAVDLRVAELLPDKDQLSNQRQWAGRQLGNTLAESLAYGHGARFKGHIPSNRIGAAAMSIRMATAECPPGYQPHQLETGPHKGQEKCRKQVGESYWYADPKSAQRLRKNKLRSKRRKKVEKTNRRRKQAVVAKNIAKEVAKTVAAGGAIRNHRIAKAAGAPTWVANGIAAVSALGDHLALAGITGVPLASWIITAVMGITMPKATIKVLSEQVKATREMFGVRTKLAVEDQEQLLIALTRKAHQSGRPQEYIMALAMAVGEGDSLGDAMAVADEIFGNQDSQRMSLWSYGGRVIMMDKSPRPSHGQVNPTNGWKYWGPTKRYVTSKTFEKRSGGKASKTSGAASKPSDVAEKTAKTDTVSSFDVKTTNTAKGGVKHVDINGVSRTQAQEIIKSLFASASSQDPASIAELVNEPDGMEQLGDRNKGWRVSWDRYDKKLSVYTHGPVADADMPLHDDVQKALQNIGVLGQSQKPPGQAEPKDPKVKPGGETDAKATKPVKQKRQSKPKAKPKQSIDDLTAEMNQAHDAGDEQRALDAAQKLAEQFPERPVDDDAAARRAKLKSLFTAAQQTEATEPQPIKTKKRSVAKKRQRIGDPVIAAKPVSKPSVAVDPRETTEYRQWLAEVTARRGEQLKQSQAKRKSGGAKPKMIPRPSTSHPEDDYLPEPVRRDLRQQGVQAMPAEPDRAPSVAAKPTIDPPQPEPPKQLKFTQADVDNINALGTRLKSIVVDREKGLDLQYPDEPAAKVVQRVMDEVQGFDDKTIIGVARVMSGALHGPDAIGTLPDAMRAIRDKITAYYERAVNVQDYLDEKYGRDRRPPSPDAPRADPALRRAFNRVAKKHHVRARFSKARAGGLVLLHGWTFNGVPMRMAIDGPKDGDVDPQTGLVFHNHRWHAKEDVARAQESKQSSPVSSWAAKRFKDPAHAQAFVKWFGDSKVVNEQGEPLVVYHGGPKGGITTFKTYGHGASDALFLSSNPNEAKHSRGTQAALYPVYLSLKKPLILRAEDSHDVIGEVDPENEVINQAASDGYDSVIWTDDDNDITTYAVFESTQIKSATGNRGTFDPNNPHIGMSIRMATAWTIARRPVLQGAG